MKIICDVEVSNRLLPSQNMTGSRRAVRSTLGIGKLDSKSENIFILHQTTQNKTGNKYKVTGNIEGVFTRFSSEGKATIRFRAPPHDLCLRSADPIQLNCFLRLLRNTLEGKADRVTSTKAETGNLKENNQLPGEVGKSKSRLGVISPASKLLAGIKRTLKIFKRSDYPSVLGFPKTLEELQISRLQLSCLDRQVTRLPLLRMLDLTDNRLSSLPKELSLLPNLRELRLAHNSFGESCDKGVSSTSTRLNATENEKWGWIGGSLLTSLTFLDLSYNKIKHVPDVLCRLKSLLNLKLDHNEISVLPSGLGTMCKLRLLSVSNNSLLYLPGSLRKLRLEAIDISNNPPMEREMQLPRRLWPESLSPSAVLGMPTLFEFAARKVVSMGLHPTASDVPYPIVTYLSSANFCICGGPCFESKLKVLISMDPRSIAFSVAWTSGSGNPPTLAYLCSLKCLESVKKAVY
ncbi:leucine-rich repeat protein 1 [Ischnura elegans]|uniref:leucine-rich repeat protein 1 n=1 Tax=Ischnura elegans TaxID=197161 RepID=UPI001ED88660|nr:leucine-rich repeat protein 1 [Ischnura elegans]